MYKVLIADDEPWVVYGLTHLIQWEDYGFTICDTAANGAEALEKCMKLKPDALFSDIRMPGLNGLALLERLREKLPEIEVVFISGYSEFEYAQKAIRFGAADYLVKRVTAKHLAEVCERLKQKLDAKASGNNDTALFTMLALLDDDYKLSVAEWTSQTADNFRYPNYRMATFAGDFSEMGKSLPEWGCFVLKTGRDKFSALVGYQSEEMFYKWLDSLHANKGIAGISREADSSALFSDIFKQADIAYYTALLTNKHEFIEYSKEANKEAVWQAVDLLADVESALNQNEKALCGKKIDALKTVCMDLMLDRIAQVYNALAMLFNRCLPENFEIEACEYRRLASDYADIEEMFNFFHQCLNMDDEHSPALFKQITQYIDEHYTEDLRVSNMASAFHFSPNYFSALFKKRTGITFKNYLTGKRITLAKALLNESGLSLQEIVERVGYNDYFQFIKTFKRETGVTPGQYRKHGG